MKRGKKIYVNLKAISIKEKPQFFTIVVVKPDLNAA